MPCRDALRGVQASYSTLDTRKAPCTRHGGHCACVAGDRGQWVGAPLQQASGSIHPRPVGTPCPTPAQGRIAGKGSPRPGKRDAIRWGCPSKGRVSSPRDHLPSDSSSRLPRAECGRNLSRCGSALDDQRERPAPSDLFPVPQGPELLRMIACPEDYYAAVTRSGGAKRRQRIALRVSPRFRKPPKTRPEKPAQRHINGEVILSSVAPSALQSTGIRDHGLTAAAIHCRPFGPDRQRARRCQSSTTDSPEPGRPIARLID